MSIWLDRKYMTLLPLQGFTRKNNGSWEANFRCPICGDSKLNTSKKRAWFSKGNNCLVFHCFNCADNPTMSFSTFLKNFFPSYYQDYRKDNLEERFGTNRPQKTIEQVDPFKTITDELNLTKIRNLPQSHQVVKYIKNRKIPIDLVFDCYYSDNFYEWCKNKQPDNFKEEFSSDKRLVFPFRDKSGIIFGLSGRSIEYATPKYLTIKLDNDYPKIYGLEKLNPHKTVYVTEGQIDSLFIDNCLGVIGAMGSVDQVCKFCGLNKSNVVLVTDNEPRNKETCKFIKKNLEKGYNVFLWPKEYKVKDINELVEKYELTREEIKVMIDKNVVKGMNGLIKLSNWRKC